MNEWIKILLVVIGTLVALFIGHWYVILIIAMLYGYFTDLPMRKSASLCFIAVFLAWSLSLLFRDMGFARSPMTLFADAAGSFPNWAVPLVAGAIGGLVAFCGAAGTRLLRKG